VSTPCVLDASALLALLNKEPGWEKVDDAIFHGAVMSAVNLSEVGSRLVREGTPATEVAADLRLWPIEIIPFGIDDANAAAAMALITRSAGLSLGDRACLSLAMKLETEALTADRAWSNLSLNVVVTLLR
jgi:ribonuclease VapC